MADAENRRNVFIFTWKIENYIDYETINSPIFYIHSLDSGFRLKLSVSADGRRLGLYLEQINGEPEELDLLFLCLDSDDSILLSKEKFNVRIGPKSKCFGIDDFMFLDDVLSKERATFLPQDTLTLQCKIWKSIEQLSESVHCYGRTRVSTETSSFVWRIEAFSELLPDLAVAYVVRKGSQGDPIFSMYLNLHETLATSKCFNLEFTSANVIPTQRMALTSPKKGFYNFKLSFLNDSAEEKVHHEIRRLEFNGPRTFKILLTDELMKEENGFIIGDTLSLKFHFMFYGGEFSEEIEHTEYGCNKKPEKLAVIPKMNKKTSSREDVEKSLHDGQIPCDVKLRLGTEYIPVHKSILSAKSPVFQSKFKDAKDIVEVSDVSLTTLRQMILYMYTDSVDDAQLADIYKLYLAAKKYEILDLQMKCFQMLIEKLDKHNANEMLNLAVEYADENLKSQVMAFVKNKGISLV